MVASFPLPSPLDITFVGFRWSLAASIVCRLGCHATSNHLFASRVGWMGLTLPMALWDASRQWVFPRAVYIGPHCASSSVNLSVSPPMAGGAGPRES
jgi:hypothetical protein